MYKIKKFQLFSKHQIGFRKINQIAVSITFLFVSFLLSNRQRSLKLEISRIMEAVSEKVADTCDRSVAGVLFVFQENPGIIVPLWCAVHYCAIELFFDNKIIVVLKDSNF